MLYKLLFNKSPALLLAICLLLGLTLPLPALARGVPTQIEAAAATQLLADIQVCTVASLAGQDKWVCVEDKYAELKALHLDVVDPDAHWYAAWSSWKRGDVALTYERLNLIKAAFPAFSKKLSNAEFTVLKDWLAHLDLNYGSVKVHGPWFSAEVTLLEGPASTALTFANWQLKGTGHFEGYLQAGEYTFRAKTVVVKATRVESPVTGSGKLVIVYPTKTPRTYPSRHKLEWNPEKYVVVRWASEADCLADNNFLWRYNLNMLAVGKPLVYDLHVGTYWVATYLNHETDEFLRQDDCQEVVIGVDSETTFMPEITSTPAMVERQLHPPTQDFLDGTALIGPGLRSDNPTQVGSVGVGVLLEGRMSPSWWINADPNWTTGYQLWLDVRTFGTYTPAVSWGLGGTVGRDWYVPTKFGMVTFLADGGLMLGTGVFGTTCSFNTAATSLSETDMTCGGGEGLLFPRLQPDSYDQMSGGFDSFYAGITARAMARLDVKNSGWYVGVGTWSIGQMFLVPGWKQSAKVVLTDGTSVEVPFQWDTSLVFRGQVLPGIVLGGRFP